MNRFYEVTQLLEEMPKGNKSFVFLPVFQLKLQVYSGVDKFVYFGAFLGIHYDLQTLLTCKYWFIQSLGVSDYRYFMNLFKPARICSFIVLVGF